MKSDIAQWLGNMQARKRRTEHPLTGSYDAVKAAATATRVTPVTWGLTMQVERISEKVIAINPVWSELK